LLQDGDYFAGDESGTCTTGRVPVSVTVNTPAAPTQTTAGATFDPCQSSIDDINTVSEIIARFAPLAGYDIEVFDDEFGTTVLGSGDILIPEASYYVGQRNLTATPSCPSLRIAIRYSPILALEPTGEATQIFCEGATVADLEASGINRWYSTAKSQPALEGSTPLMNGETYFASQIVNKSDSSNPPCESVDRFEVTVTVNNIITEETQRFCASIGEGNNFRKPEVQDLSPDGTWYADDTFTTPLAFDEELIDKDDYFMRIPENCETIVVTAEFFDTPNAGSTTSLNVCSNEDAFNLVDEINDSQLGPAQQTGRFSPVLSTGTGSLIFNPAEYEPGTYNFKYIVDGNVDCPTDDSRITVIVQAAPNAGTDVAETVCSAELENPEALIAKFSSLLEGRDQNGTFANNSPEDLAIQYSQNPIGTFTTTYTVTNEAGCTDSASISIEVLPSPDAGDDATVILADEGTDSIDLFDRLGSPDPDGSWAPGNGTFDPETDTPGVFTYTVISTNGCEDTATVTVVAECPVVEETTQEFCASIGTGNDFRKPQVRDLLPADATWYATADSEDPLSGTTTLDDDVNYFAGNASGTCPDRTPVNVVILDTPNAGKTTSITVCSNAEPFDLIDRILHSQLGAPDRDGTFSPVLASGGSIFDPSVDIARQYKYTVARGTCTPDDSRITVNIKQAPNAGVDINEKLCINPAEDLLPTAQEFMALYADDNRNLGGTFDPSLESLLIAFTANPFGTFATKYSVTANGCTDTANLSLTITEKVPADAGEDVPLTFCSTDGVKDLYEFLVDANPNGSFEGLENGMFDTSTATIGETKITYTVSEDDTCVIGTDFAVFTITVIQGSDAGDDGSIEVSRTDTPFNLFTELEGSPLAEGIWSPGNTDGSFDPATGDGGVYTYTLTNGVCEDFATVTVVILDEEACPIVEQTSQIFCESISDTNGNNPRKPRVSDLIPAGVTWYAATDSETALPANTVLVNGTTYFAGNSTGTCELRTPVLVTIDDSPNAGATTFITVCADDAPFDLLDVFNESILGVPDAGGIVTPALSSGTTLFDPSIDLGRQYKYTVQSENEFCPDDFAFITINVLINEDANAGVDFERDFCTTAEDVDLFDLLADGVTMTGTFEGYENGIFSPSTSGEDIFEITYNVGENLPCVAGADSATITITVNAASEAPVADANQSFCLVNNPTVASLVASGEDGWFATENPEETPLPLDTVLNINTVYFAGAGSGTCRTFTAVTVTITDTDSPTLPTGENEFCRSDNPTLQDLLNNFNGSGIRIYSSLTGGTAIASTTALQDGVEYFATATNATSGCESSERKAIRVEVNFCGIPEGFSPNGDNINDKFVIPEIAINYPNFNIEVYNRWGNMVFKGNASTPDWDGFSNQSGTLGDGVLPVGVYFYILNYNDGATTSEQGKLYLSR
jgi:gliding motility-associated-like protein